MSCLCSGNCFRRELPAGVVDGVGRIEDQLTDGHNGIPVVDQAVEDGRQGLRRVQRGVVEQHDAPRLHLGCYAPAYRIRVVVLPVQGVHIPLDRFHADYTWVNLPEMGIKGNSHMLMMDNNNDQIAGLINDWLVEKGLCGNK